MLRDLGLDCARRTAQSSRCSDAKTPHCIISDMVAAKRITPTTVQPAMIVTLTPAFTQVVAQHLKFALPPISLVP